MRLFLVKKLQTLFYINFSNIFPILDNGEIGQQFEKSNLKSFLYPGTTLVTLSIVGKTPVENKMLNISANCHSSVTLISLQVCCQAQLIYLDQVKILCFVSLIYLQDLEKGVLSSAFQELREMFMRRIDILFFFSNCCKIIVKDI